MNFLDVYLNGSVLVIGINSTKSILTPDRNLRLLIKKLYEAVYIQYALDSSQLKHINRCDLRLVNWKLTAHGLKINTYDSLICITWQSDRSKWLKLIFNMLI